ncbi:ABC transporter permease [Aquibaculum arenosum]|uniref:ABC transporter permease n=1 Tax=Aquibaculum arenosum TaxID=3032591 RepID=A0ABT5YLE4_9PROT|nr:ABC transporter permease [Fodinicurvata sp. CAU 1616]MDF2095651.1 ABC transporter permease [Fodinicurvata sp. CAU 1616]
MTVSTATALTGSDLKRRLRRAEWRGRLRAIALVVPLLLFLIFFFIVPIARMMWLSVDNSELPSTLPRFAEEIQQWDPTETPLPDESVLALFAEELRAAAEARDLAGVARRLNTEVPGFRTTIMGTARRLPDSPEGSWSETLIGINEDWAEAETWLLLRRASTTVTPYYLLASMDLRMGAEGGVEAAPRDQAIYRDIFARTFTIAVGVTLLCLLLGYPLAYKLANLPARISNLLLILVLLPFWTSLLVRTTSWIVLLQREGPINQALQGAGMIQDPLQLIYNRFGVYVAMTHILLPFMVLPLYSVMRGINPALPRAATGLGAHPFTAFRRVYLPLTTPGIGAGCLLVFILSIGYYITPALVGGANDQMVSWFIAFFTNQTVNWGMASALGSLLLVAVLIIYWLYIRLVGVERMRLG